MEVQREGGGLTGLDTAAETNKDADRELAQAGVAPPQRVRVVLQVADATLEGLGAVGHGAG